MKRNDIPIILATAAYSFLFYQQSPGVNYFLFNTILILLLVIRDQSLIFSKTFIAAAAGCIISSYFVLGYDTSLPYVADVISLVLVAGVSFDRNSSFIISCFHSCYSWISMAVYLPLDLMNGLNSPDVNNGRANLLHKIVLAIIPFMIFLLFFFIYRSGNPIFDQLAANINFDFISLPWCFFTLGGFILMYGFFKQRVISFVQKTDQNTSDELIPISLEDHVKTMLGNLISLPNLIYTGVLLLIMLNGLLALVNGIDIYYLGFLHATPPGITFSQYLHNGTNSLIASIILAVSIILFYFRGYLNFYEHNNWLRKLSYIWIAQNIILVISTAYRNTVYISNYGMTHKRIGVYVYLFLCVVGLFTTFIKIRNAKNNWFLFRKNAWIAYGFMIVACPFDWNSIITDFDINWFQSDKTMEIDQRYLADLGHTNMARLFQYYIVEGKTLHAHADTSQSGSMSLGRSSSDQNEYAHEIRNMIWYEYLYLERDYARHKWPSHCMSKSNNLHAVEKMIKDNNLDCPVTIR